MSKHPTVALVCQYLSTVKALSGRSMARLLSVSPMTWSRYARGLSSPGSNIKYKLVKLSGAPNYTSLIKMAIAWHVQRHQVQQPRP